MTEKEWRMFNDILLEIYYAGSLETFGERCLKLIRILIPYTQGYFLVIDEDGRLDVAHSVFENVDPETEILRYLFCKRLSDADVQFYKINGIPRYRSFNG